MCCTLRASADSAIEAGAPVDETEVTPEMVKAGAEAVWEFRGFDPNFVAEKVFLAMMEYARVRKAAAISPELDSFMRCYVT
jgi:hypothetical protein